MYVSICSRFVSRALRSSKNVQKLQELGEEGLIWANDSASQFDVGKYQLVHHPRRTTPEKDRALTVTIGGTAIVPKASAKYLGVFIDSQLKFKEHVEYASGKGVAASAALSRLSNPSSGMPQSYIRRLFIGLVAPRMEYALGVWYNPVREAEGRKSRVGSVGFATKLGKPQRLACRIAVGGLRTTATQALDLHANILPIIPRLNLAAFKFALRLRTLPSSHPLQKTVKRCLRVPLHHKSPIHNLMEAFPELRQDIEIIDSRPVPAPPPDALSFSIANSKDEAKAAVGLISESATCIFTDGSGFKNGVGAAAWLKPLNTAPNGGVARLLHLGKDTHHTVFEAELLGAILALDIICNTPRLTKAIILLDSQAAIQALQSRKTQSGRYLVKQFHDTLSRMIREGGQREFRWYGCQDIRE